jgi:hypothetical protein
MSKKQEIRLVDLDRNLRSYRFLGHEAEVLGTRMDAARLALSKATSAWAKRYWKSAVEQLVFQWRSLPALHDGDAQMSMIPRWTISYDYYSRDDGIGHGFGDKIYERLFREPDLQGSWDRVREQRLARNQ